MLPLYHPLNFYAKYAIIKASPYGQICFGGVHLKGIEVIEVTPFILRLKGIGRDEVEKIWFIESVCHKYKHIFMEGYPCGRKTRKKLGIRMERQQNPGICLTYLVTPQGNDTVTVRILVSSVEEALKRYTRREILWFVQDFMQGLTEELI